MTDASPTPPQPPSRATSMRLADCKTIADALQTAQFQRAVADAAPSHMTSQRLMATFRQAARNNPAFNECNLMSVLGTFMTCTFLGLEPNTPLGQAYMIPFKRRRWDKASRQMVDDGYDLQLIIGYQGYLDLAFRNPRVQSIAAHAVYEGDDFSFEYGSNEHLQHRPKGLHAEGDVPRYFYMYSKLQGGQAFEVLPTAKVIQIRNGSQGYQAALAAKERAEKEGWRIPASYTEAPWVKHFIAMGQKTAVRHGFKWLPKTVEMAAVTRLEDAQDKNLIDFGPVIEGNVNPLEEDLPPLHEPRAEPGAAHGERQRDDEDDGGPVAPLPGEQPAAARPARQAPAQRETKPPPASPAPTGPTPATPAPTPAEPAFSAHLADAAGEIHEAAGDGGFFTDPVAFAMAYTTLWHGTAADHRQALGEHNADALSEAFGASQRAQEILTALQAKQEPQESSPAPTQPSNVLTAVVVATTNGRPDLKGYLDALRTAAAAQNAESFDEWSALQRPVIIGLSQVTRRAAEKIVADRATALGADKPPPAAEPVAPAPTTAAASDAPPDADGSQGGALLTGEPLPPAMWGRNAQSLIDDMDACKTMHDLNALANNAATGVKLRQIKEADPDEHARLLAYAAARRTALTPKAGG